MYFEIQILVICNDHESNVEIFGDIKFVDT
jgi:hypothetical protein